MNINYAKSALHEAPYRILLVDDEAFHHELLGEIFRDDGHLLDSASDGSAALAAIKSHAYDVVLLDYRMPGLTGVEVCHRVRQELDLEMLPIIMLTGQGAPETQVECIQAGANDFVTKPYNPIVLKARVRSAVQHYRALSHLDNADHILFALARLVESRDKTTGDHCARLAHMSSLFGQQLGLDFNQLEAMRRGGVIHDIGKVAIPDNILLKNGPLTDTEWDLMRQHTVVGAQLCELLPSLRSTGDIVRSHHEKWNGSGYPDGLKGDSIPLLARIFQIVDIYDALSSERPYKKPFTKEKIVAIFKDEIEQGGCDPDLTREFIPLVLDPDRPLHAAASNVEQERSGLGAEIKSLYGGVAHDERLISAG